MTEPFFSIGGDVAKKKLDVYSRSSGEHKVFPDDIKGLDSMFLYWSFASNFRNFYNKD